MIHGSNVKDEEFGLWEEKRMEIRSRIEIRGLNML